jgi:hypothetical protein
MNMIELSNWAHEQTDVLTVDLDDYEELHNPDNLTPKIGDLARENHRPGPRHFVRITTRPQLGAWEEYRREHPLTCQFFRYQRPKIVDLEGLR